jgi:hypothetical protein
MVDIEQEYSDHVYDGWAMLSDSDPDIFRLHRHPDIAYNTISLSSIEFLQEKLRELETEDLNHLTTT